VELKDVVLSTLAEIENIQNETVTKQEDLEPLNEEKVEKEPVKNTTTQTNNEEVFLSNLKERILVLFEGFQSPKNKNVEAKLDLTLNFFEYMLATIEERLDTVKDQSK
jgi:formate dehydrogenase maturation protein FdhE